MVNKLNSYDYVVIGSGPCGMVSGNLLSKKGKTIIIEEGPELADREEDIYTFNQISNGYVGGGINIAFGYPPVLLSEGKCVGGGSAVNSSLHHRAPSYVWHKWRDLYKLEGFDEKLVEKSYEEIENIFSAKKGNIKTSIFYETAELIGEKVARIPRWGEEDNEGRLNRWTARKIFYMKLIKNGTEILHLTKFLSAERDKNNNWNIYLKDLKNDKKFRILSSNLILAMGAGKTPLALRNLGLKHSQLGKFEIHPSARVSCYFPNSERSKSIVEPFQITGYFPHLMIGSSATRSELSASFYPYKKNVDKINFSFVQNFYAMAPSNKKGKIVLTGLFKGLKFYFLDNKAKFYLKKGIKLIIKIAKEANSPLIYHSGMTLDLNKINNEKIIYRFIESSIKKTLSSVHVMSSASIGENRRLCPLNSKGKIPGINNLLIVDQSSLPTCPTVNPQATSCVISLINTKKFLNEKK